MPAQITNSTSDVAAFRVLHARDRLLLLPNAWDAASAAIARSVGAEAIATTSAGVAWACGYADGEALPHDERTAALRAIKRAAGQLPVSADFEAGYSDKPHDVAAGVRELRQFGIVGINIEDGAQDAAILERKIAAIKATLRENGDDIFINARTDIYLYGAASGAERVHECIERAKRYAAAGADGIFVPLVLQRDEIAEIAAATSLPLNVLAMRGLPSGSELLRRGVRRISAGGRLAELAYGTARYAARAFLQSGDVAAMFSEHSSSHAEMDSLFDSR